MWCMAPAPLGPPFFHSCSSTCPDLSWCLGLSIAVSTWNMQGRRPIAAMPTLIVDPPLSRLSTELLQVWVSGHHILAPRQGPAGRRDFDCLEVIPMPLRGSHHARRYGTHLHSCGCKPFQIPCWMLQRVCHPEIPDLSVKLIGILNTARSIPCLQWQGQGQRQRRRAAALQGCGLACMAAAAGPNAAPFEPRRSQ